MLRYVRVRMPDHIVVNNARAASPVDFGPREAALLRPDHPGPHSGPDITTAPYGHGYAWDDRGLDRDLDRPFFADEHPGDVECWIDDCWAPRQRALHY